MTDQSELGLTGAEFDRIALKCRWDKSNLAMVRQVLIDREPLSEVAKAYSVQPQYVSTYRRRFLAKVEQDKIDRFTQEQRPRSLAVALKPYLAAMTTLRDKGYSVDQIAAFLKDNGVEASASSVRKYLNDEDDRA